MFSGKVPKRVFLVDCFSAARSRVIFFELKQVGHKNGAIKKPLIFFKNLYIKSEKGES